VAIQPAGFTTTSASNSGNEVPWQFVAVVTFDGHGGLSADWTAAVNGAISGYNLENAPAHAIGSYSLNSDCKGSFALVGPDDPGGTANLAVIGGGAEIFGIWTNSGSTASFDAKKQ
jgi:hypothetical protein